MVNNRSYCDQFRISRVALMLAPEGGVACTCSTLCHLLHAKGNSDDPCVFPRGTSARAHSKKGVIKYETICIPLAEPLVHVRAMDIE